MPPEALLFAPFGEVQRRAGQSTGETSRVRRAAEPGGYLHTQRRITDADDELADAGGRFHDLRTVPSGGLDDHIHAHGFRSFLVEPTHQGRYTQENPESSRPPGQTVRVRDQSVLDEP